MKAYKYRLYPTNNQSAQLNKTFGCVRLVYNLMLDERKKHIDDTNNIVHNPSYFKLERPFLKEVDSLALANAWTNLNSAFSNFKRDGVGFPKFKSKKNNHFSYTTNNQHGSIRIENKKIKLPRVGFVKLKQHREFTGEIKSVTVSKTPTDKYYVSILVEESIEKLEKLSNSIGIDLGLKVFATCSNGDVIENPKHLRKLEKQLAKAEKSKSRKKKGSHNRNKQRLKVARIHEKINNQRKDFLNKLSTKLIRENQTIIIEDLQVKNMVKNHKLAKSISDASWSEFRRMLEYKAIWYGRTIVIADKFYASSQLCSRCGCKNNHMKDLAERVFTCTSCGFTLDRDLNASINLSTVGTTDNSLGKLDTSVLLTKKLPHMREQFTQGFYTDKGEFLTRAEAKIHFEACGQTYHSKFQHDTELYSEDLY